jgi:NDP-sugar pyrophosphorylase family protein
MRAVILAGGRGARLAPYTTVVPKPLLPVGETPILEIVLRQLARAGFDHITLTLGHLSTYVRAFLTQHPSLTRLAKIDCVEEESPTGTAGSLASVPGLTDTFLVMNGDILTTLDYRALLAHHAAEKARLTIAAHQKPVPIDLGVLQTDAAGRVTGYVEKPTVSYTVSMGVYVYDPRVLAHVPAGQYLDFPDLVLKLLAAGEKVTAYPSGAFWLDLGRFDDLQRAADIFRERQGEFLPP